MTDATTPEEFIEATETDEGFAPAFSDDVEIISIDPATQGTDEYVGLLFPTHLAEDVEAHQPLTPWTAADYNPLVTGSGAIKLASSGVAPLVAAARGYESVQEDQSKDFAKRRGVGDARTKKGSQFLQSFRDDGDVLVMPWYTTDMVVTATQDLAAQAPSSLQIKPQNPRTNDAGKVVKYEFLVGDDTVLDYHPAVTKRWANSAARVLIAEGLLKGDSAFTAMLRAFPGIDDDELLLTETDRDNRLSALTRLNALIERIPNDQRTAIISIAGVGNWRNNVEWTSLNLKEREVLVAFDADVASNYNVWNMADQMFSHLERSKRAEPRMVSISHNPKFVAAVAEDPKMGLDDFFHHIGTWTDVDGMVMPELPEKPSRPITTEDGMTRVSSDGTETEIYVIKDEVGRWQRHVGIGGRIKQFIVDRSPTDDERKGFPFGTGVVEQDNPANIAIEIAWIDDLTGERMTTEVTGPSVLLNYTPAEWPRHGAYVPPTLLAHREWPPSNKKGAEWLSAIKSHEREQQHTLTKWGTMGWVPVPGEDTQAFIIGDQVIAANKNAEEATIPGVSEEVLPSASKFGLRDIYRAPRFEDVPRRGHDLEGDEKAPSGVKVYSLREDIKKLFEVYFDNSPWTTVQAAATIIAAALRPAIPLPTRSTCYLVGAPGKGKSWTASQMMSFYQWRPAGWDALPGSASDTFASTENAIAKTILWVADDLAPGTDRNAIQQQENSLGNIIRSVFNGINKRRMNSDMTARATPAPMALFVLTAENEHSIGSIRQRVATIEFTGLVGENMDGAIELADTTTTASRVVAAIIRYFVMEGQKTGGWRALYQRLVAVRKVNEEQAKAILTSGFGAIAQANATRPAEIAADLSIGLYGLEALCRHLGMDEYADRLSFRKGDQHVRGLSRLLTEQVQIGNQGRDEETPGQVLISCIRQLLSSNKAHIANQDRPGEPPISDEQDADRLNTLLGWSREGDDWRPKGTRIGYYTSVKPRDAKEPVEVFVISRDEAFNLAQREYPSQIQHGASQNTSWKNVWNLGLVHPAYRDKRPSAGVVKQFRVGSDAESRARIDGIPLSRDAVMGGRMKDTDD